MPRVLLADGAPDLRLRMSLYLRHSGMEILTAQNGEEALQVSVSGRPDLILLDLSLTGMSAHEVCRRIKSNPATAATSVVFLVSAENRADNIQSLQAGADDFFSKSIERDELLIRIKSLINRTRTRPPVVAGPHESALPGDESHLKSGRVMGEALTTRGASANLPAEYQSRFDAVILFADLRGFTRLAEKLRPSDVVLLLNEYFSLLTSVTYHHNGVIFNMAGDCLLVGFGVPFEQADASELAIKCGMQMLAEFDTLSVRWRAEYGLETGLGVGVNRGEVVAGKVGSAAYSNFTVIGDAVNIASRLMQRARAGELLLSERVADDLKTTQLHLEMLLLPPLTVRGRLEPINLYCIPYKGRIDTRT